MKVIVTGGRFYDNSQRVAEVLDTLNVTELAQGGATGVDAFALAWAKDRKIPVQTFPANWQIHGKAAGPIRNAHMLECFRPDLVVVFPGGNGTAHMRRIAEMDGCKILDVTP